MIKHFGPKTYFSLKIFFVIKGDLPWLMLWFRRVRSHTISDLTCFYS